MEETELKETITLQVSNGNQIHDPITINNVCRICANQNDKLIGVYTEDGRNNDLANKINTYLPIKVSESDQLPLQCCWECASTVLAWHDLVLTSVEADRRLRNCDYTTLKQVEFEQEHVSGDENVDGIDTPSQEQQNVTESFSTTLNAFCQNEEKQEQICPQFDAVYLVDNPIDNQTEMKTDEKIIIEEEFLNDNKNMYNFSCQYCPLMFITEEEILKHVEDQHNNDVDINTSNNKKNMPAILSKRTKNKLDRELVNAAKVVVDGRIYYNCKQCGKSLHSPYTYVWHMRIHTGERPFVCDLCGKQFRVSQGLVRHLKETHERIRNFPCDLCGRMFATKRNVEEHRRIHTNERPYICDLCGKAFKQKASLFVHNRSHSDLFPFKCSYCAQGFRTKPPLLIHITRHTGEKPYPCDICGRCFRIKYELKRHRLIHSDEKPFSCDECGLSFRQKRYLRNHLKLNHQNMLNPKNNRIVEESVPDDRPARKKFQETNVIKQTAQFSQAPSERSPNKYNELVNADEKMCLLCKTPFKNKLSLKRHMKDIHNVQQPRYRRKKCEINDGFFCSVCDKGFTRKFDMEKHFLNKHSTLSGPSLNIKRKTNKDLKTLEKCKVINEDKTSYFKCDYCSHTFKKSSNLLRHRTIHSGIRPYCCHICGKIFRLAGNLDRHINEHHHKLKKFNCDICNKKFLSRNTRDEHMNIHTNNRPFICDTCGKAFKQAASLHIHKLFHSNIFKFTCEVCGKKFRRAQELKVHQWMHTGEKPFKCEECNVAFRSNQSLKRHLRGHGKSIECVCLICGSTFIHERYLKIHSRIHIQNTDGN